jgi:hypothetical protein
VRVLEQVDDLLCLEGKEEIESTLIVLIICALCYSTEVKELFDN